MAQQYIKTQDRVHPIDEPQLKGTVVSIARNGRCAVKWDGGLKSNVLPITLELDNAENKSQN